MTDGRNYAPTLATLGELVDAHRGVERKHPMLRNGLYRKRATLSRMRGFFGNDIADIVEERPLVSSLAAFAIALVVGCSVAALARVPSRF